MKHTFGFMFKDTEYLKKILPFFILIFLTNIFYAISNAVNVPQVGFAIKVNIASFLFSLVAALISFITSGYGIACTKAFSTPDGEKTLPFIDYKNNFVTGLKFFIAILFPILIYGIVLLGIHLLKAVLPVIVVNVLSIFVIVDVAIIYGYGALGFLYLFAKEGKILNFLKYKTVFNLIKTNGINYLKYFGLWAGVYILLGILNALLIFGLLKIMNDITFIVVYNILKSLVPCYTVYLFGYFIAKAIKVVK